MTIWFCTIWYWSRFSEIGMGQNSTAVLRQRHEKRMLGIFYILAGRQRFKVLE